MKKTLFFLTLALWALVSRGVAQDGAADDVSEGNELTQMSKKSGKLLKKYCYDCHDASSVQGGVDLESLSRNIAQDLPSAELWSKVLGEINSGDMPPSSSTKIPDTKKADFLRELSVKMVDARKSLTDSGGVITIRRLNRREYLNTFRDLVGIEPDVTDLPSDQGAGDFDTSGASLFFSSGQLETYRQVAKQAITDALGRKPTKRIKKRVQAEAVVTKKFQESYDKYVSLKRRLDGYKANGRKDHKKFGFKDSGAPAHLGRDYKSYFPQIERYLSLPESKTGAPLLLLPDGDAKVKIDNFRVPAGGKYILRVRAGVYPDTDRQDQFLKFGYQRYNIYQIGDVQRVTGTVDKPEIIEAEIDLPVDNNKFSLFAIQRRFSGEMKLWNRFQAGLWENKVGPPPHIWVDWIEVEGPISKIVETPVQSQFFAKLKSKRDETRHFRKALKAFATDAFRGKEPDNEYISALMKVFEETRAESTYAKAVTETLAIVLASPSFLYLAEPHGEQRELVSDRELAIRLSYLLWGEAPDKTLLRLGESNRLSKPENLIEQTRRLLLDPRFDRFIEGFVEQWLGMDRLDTFQFPAPYSPRFDGHLRSSARQEVYQTYATIVRGGMPLQRMLKSDFVVVDDVLIDFYDLPEQQPGEGFRKVTIDDDSVRGGLLGMAAIHMMGSDGTHGSIVERGAWVLRHILDDPPPPAPANVPQLSKPRGGRSPSARDLLAAHTSAPQCAQCHEKIDPIGYGLQNFSATGAWQTREKVLVAASGNRSKGQNPYRAVWREVPIEVRGKLPNGRKFRNFLGLRDAVADEGRAFSEKYAKDLIAYGLGRPYSLTDQPLLDEMMNAAIRGKNRASAYIIALITSKQFRLK